MQKNCDIEDYDYETECSEPVVAHARLIGMFEIAKRRYGFCKEHAEKAKDDDILAWER